MAAEATILRIWQATRDSNPQHSVLETDALPVELVAFIWFRAQKDTAPYPFKQGINLLNSWFYPLPLKGRQLCHYPLLNQPLIHLIFIDFHIYLHKLIRNVFLKHIIRPSFYRSSTFLSRKYKPLITLISLTAKFSTFKHLFIKFFWPFTAHSLKIPRLFLKI